MLSTSVSDAVPLCRSDYVTPTIFEAERARLFPSQPMLGAMTADISRVGDFRLLQVGGESMIVARSDDGRARALANVCGHRGFPLVEEVSGCRRSLSCPYHGWRYRLDGTLLSARGLHRVQDARHPGLRRLGCVEGGGAVLAAMRPVAQDTVAPTLDLFDQFGLGSAALVASERFVARCNWKLWTENFLECWHCATNHPELTATEAHVRQFEIDDHAAYVEDRRAVDARARQHGLVLPESVEIDTDADVFEFREAVALGGGRSSPSVDGRRIGPSLANEGLDGTIIFGALGPFLHYTIAVDHAALFSFLPLSIDETAVEIRWLAHPSVSSDAASWLWRRTLEQDRWLTERLQTGVGSRLFRSGQFLPHEQRTGRFVRWWRRQMSGRGKEAFATRQT